MKWITPYILRIRFFLDSRHNTIFYRCHMAIRVLRGSRRYRNDRILHSIHIEPSRYHDNWHTFHNRNHSIPIEYTCYILFHHNDRISFRLFRKQHTLRIVYLRRRMT